MQNVLGISVKLESLQYTLGINELHYSLTGLLWKCVDIGLRPISLFGCPDTYSGITRLAVIYEYIKITKMQVFLNTCVCDIHLSSRASHPLE